jgi:hypothetical protein
LCSEDYQDERIAKKNEAEDEKNSESISPRRKQVDFDD